MTASDGAHRSSARQTRVRARSAWVGALLVVLGGAAPLRAQLDGAAQGCIDSYHATLRLVGQETDRWGRRCLRDAERGLLDDADACLAGDAAGRIARREQRVARLYASGRCSGSEPIQQGAAVGSAAHRGAAGALLGALLGRPFPTGETPAAAERACRARVLRRTGEAFAAVTAAHRACAAAGMRAATVVDVATLDAQCGTWAQIDAAGNASAALDRLATDTVDACVGADLAAALPGLDPACHAAPPALSACAAAQARCRACAAWPGADGQQLDCDLFDDGAGNQSCEPEAIGRRACTADVDIRMFNSALPLTLAATASLALHCGAVDDGRAACDCALPEFSAVVVPAIGDLCLSAVPGCPAGILDCAAGTPLDARLIVDHNVGQCDGHDQCRGQCAAACTGLGSGFAALGSACEGFCQGGAQDGDACTASSQCPGGSCPGRIAFGEHPGLCNCTCADSRRGTPAPGLACSAGVQFSVELPSNGRCGDTAVAQHPPICLPLTSGEIRGRLLHADNMQLSIPFSGDDLVASGEPISCEAIADGALSGLAVAGQFALLDTTLGDNFGSMTVTCR